MKSIMKRLFLLSEIENDVDVLDVLFKSADEIEKIL